ncbi:putative L-type lectin-domain containing receptor kinase S-7 [Nymphaea thermarum]|nr:putative L-type lectin-domain containing receptor kinase S-7 [Nymphaea thermarum]
MALLAPLLYCFSLLHVLVEAQPYQNITLGSSLSSFDNKTAWISSSGDFSFGFSMVGGNLYVGVRYENIPKKPLVWTANRDKPAPTGSTVELTKNGSLVIKDAKGNLFLDIGGRSNGSIITHAVMLDTGNLVLQSSSISEFEWQSFDIPLTPSSLLRLLHRNTNSMLHFRRPIPPLAATISQCKVMVTFEIIEPTYSSNTFGTKGRLVFDKSGKLSIFQWENNNTVQLNPVDQIPSPSKDFYFRGTIDYDGIFRLYSYPKGRNNYTSWNIVWANQQDACNIKGICGLNSYCTNKTSNGDFDCLCPPAGFSYVDAENRFLGCKFDFPMPHCRSYRAENYVLRTIDYVNWNGGSYAELSVDESACRQACLDDCLCFVAVYGNSKCYKKRMPLRNSEPGTDGMKALFKVPGDNNSLILPPYPRNITYNDRSKQSRFGIGGIILLGISVSLLLFLIIETLALICLKRCRPHRKEEEELGVLQPEMQLTRFSYKELEKVTRGFKEKLGSGSFGTVYKGMMFSAYGQKLIAVKELDNFIENGDKEFQVEVSVIGRTHHKNLVQLLGFCDEGSHRLLVYEYMEQGCLSSFLLGSIRPDWNQRVQIAFGIARGLMYLHEECDTQIIHCDIKPENILLDGNFIPKISDFGLAKLLRHDQTKTNTDIRGTRGYVAPEWFRKMAITVKVDVYSYGVMLLEIICCRKNVELSMKDEPTAILVDWAYNCFMSKQLEILVEHDEDAKSDMKKVRKMLMVALWCIQEDPSLRPTMKKVTQMLEVASLTLLLLYCSSLLHVTVEAQQAYQNVTLGSSLSSLNNTAAWISPSGEFSFGFSRVGDNIYVGIRYEKIPEKTLQTETGPHHLVLLQDLRKKIDIAIIRKSISNILPLFLSIGGGSSGTAITQAAMLDTGNLVLQSSPGSEFKWQSFDSPTDTILPTQTLALGYKLYAPVSPTNLSTGRYYIAMQNDGNFVSYNDISEPTYASNTYGTKGRLVFDESGKISIFQWEQNKVVEITPASQIPKPSKDLYFRGMIDNDGIFRLYNYPKRRSNSWSNSWNVIWETQHSSCDIRGICGPNSYCIVENQGFDCLCPSAFSYLDANNKLLGCKPDVPFLDCKQYNPDAYGLQTIDNVNFPGGEYAIKSNIDEAGCRDWFMADCDCTLAIYSDSNCYKKRMPFLNGAPVSGFKALVKVPLDNSSLPLPPTLPEGGGRPNITSNGRSKWSRFGAVKVVLFVISVTLFLLIMIESITLICLRRSLHRQGKPVGSMQTERKLMRFSYKELEKATRGFKEKLLFIKG